MDDTDVRLLMLLSRGPRAPYRELADDLHISVQAVHRRIQILRDQKILVGFTANLSLNYLGAVRVDIVGRSGCGSVDEAIRNLRAGDSVVTTLVASGNHLYVNGILRGFGDLDAFVEFVQRATRMSNPRVAVETGGPFVPRPSRPEDGADLSHLDMRIIRALHADARKSTTDVASELGVSAATVRRRLDRMIERRAIEFTADIDPTFSGNVASILSIDLREGSDRTKVGLHLVQAYQPKVMYFIPFSNLPNFLVCATLTRTMADLRELVERIQGENDVKAVVSNVAVAGYRFDHWRDRLLAQGKASAR